jgi:hypothetical protein
MQEKLEIKTILIYLALIAVSLLLSSYLCNAPIDIEPSTDDTESYSINNKGDNSYDHK